MLEDPSFSASMPDKEPRDRLAHDIVPPRKDAAWCTVDYDNRVFQANVVHVGRGKFLIIKDNQEDTYAGRIIDASEILACDTKR